MTVQSAIAELPKVARTKLALVSHSFTASKKLQVDLIFSEMFVPEIIFPNSILSDADLKSFDEFPDDYLEFSLGVSSTTPNPDDHRATIMHIFESKQMPAAIIPSVIGKLAIQCESPLEFENRIFLMYFLMRQHPVEVDFFDIVIGASYGDAPPFLTVTLLLFLSRSQDHRPEHVAIALDFLLNNAHPVVQYVAIELFREAIDLDHGPLDRLLDAIVVTLMDLADRTRHPNIRGMIERLIELWPSEFIPAAQQLISDIFDLWKRSIGSDSILGVVSRLILAFPQNGLSLLEISEQIIEFCLAALSNDEVKCYSSVIDIIGCVIEKINKKQFFSIIDAAKELMVDDRSYIMLDFSVVFRQLLAKPNFFEMQDVVNSLVESDQH